MTAGLLRYTRLYSAFIRFGFSRELAFRANFLAKVCVEIIWLFLMLVFYKAIFRQSNSVAGWSEQQYLFFVGCYMLLEAILEGFFLSNCVNFSDLVRSGELDFYLLKPIDEQFLITCKSIELSTIPNMFIGSGLMLLSLSHLGWPGDFVQWLLFFVTFIAGVAIAYSFLVMLSSTSVWLTRNTSLMEFWWMFSNLLRYPREIYQSTEWAKPIGFVFSFILPILLVIYVPASTMVQVINPLLCLYTVLVAGVMLFVSRKFLQYALKKYRSASS